MDSSRLEGYSPLKPYEVLIEEEWLQGGLTPWIDGMEEYDVSLLHVNGTQNEEEMLELAKLEEPLHFKITLTGIVVGQNVQYYPKVPPDWYRNTMEETHVSEVISPKRPPLRAS